MTLNNNQKGSATELAVASSLMNTGNSVNFPASVERYDLVVKIGDSFKTVQCKTGSFVDGKVKFCTSSRCKSKKHNKAHKDYRGQVDYFGVYCAEINKSFLVPVDKVGIKSATLSLKNARKNQLKADDYEIGKRLP